MIPAMPKKSQALEVMPSLRPYQADAVDAAIEWMKKTVEPGLLELATGAGKSYICAGAALWTYKTTGKRVLCLQPSATLTQQNHEKYTLTGQQASIFSASAGSKCMRSPVVYGTPGTVKNALSRFGDEFGLVVIDEAHSTTPSIRAIIDHMRAKNPRLRVLGMTGTPYTMNTGYIYQYDEQGRFMDENVCRDPYYNTLLYKIQTRELIDIGFLTPVHADPQVVPGYDAASMQLNKLGQFDAVEVDRVFVGRGRLTSEIVADVVAHSRYRRGVMLFAANVAHAKEIMESLPPDISAMVGGDVNMGKAERDRVIKQYKAHKIKYLVSVGTLTTGFDAPHTDVIAILRATESPGLLQQIIGRALRLFDGKDDALLLDYAENIERHGLHDDLFKPDIKASKAPGDGEHIPAKCESCNYENLFTARKNEEGFGIDDYGYFLDAAGSRIKTEHGDMPAHYGRRCTGQIRLPDGMYERCGQRWSFKECPECHHENDIAARFCEKCKQELVDPNEKLRRDFIRMKKDPYSASTDNVLEFWPSLHTSQSGRDTVRVEYKTDYRSFTIYYTPGSRHPVAAMAWESLSKAVFKGHIAPDAATFMKFIDKGTNPLTITYRKQKDSNFFEALDHNRPADSLPLEVAA